MKHMDFVECHVYVTEYSQSPIKIYGASRQFKSTIEIVPVIQQLFVFFYDCNLFLSLLHVIKIIMKIMKNLSLKKKNIYDKIDFFLLLKI